MADRARLSKQRNNMELLSAHYETENAMLQVKYRMILSMDRRTPPLLQRKLRGAHAVVMLDKLWIRRQCTTAGNALTFRIVDDNVASWDAVG